MDRAAHAAQEERLEEAGPLDAAADQLTELLRETIGVLQVGRQADRVRVPLAQEFHGHRFQVGLVRLGVERRLQIVAGPAHDVAEEGVVFLPEVAGESPHAGPVGLPQALPRVAGRHNCLVRQPERAAKDLEVRALAGRRQGIPDPAPALQVVLRQPRAPHDEVQRLAWPAPPAPGVPQHRLVVRREHVQQVPGFDRVELHRRGGGQEQAPGPRGDLVEEGEEVVRVRFLVLPPSPQVLPARPVGLVHDHALVAEALQELGCLRAAGDEPLRHEADAPRAPSDALGTRAGVFDGVLVHPLAPSPHRRGQGEKVLQFVLPLPEQRLRREHEHRPRAMEGHELRREGQLEGLPEPHLIGQHQPGAVGTTVGVEGLLHEGLLVRPQPVLLAVDGRLDDGRGRLGVLPPGLHASDDLAAGEPSDVLHHEVREPDGERARPQGVELLLHPGHGLERVVLPHELVVELPGVVGLVGAPHEGGLPPVGQRHHAGLAVDEAELVAGQNLHLELAGPEELEEPLEARPALGSVPLGLRGAPLAAQGEVGRLRRLHVPHVEVRVAHDAHRAGDAL